MRRLSFSIIGVIAAAAIAIGINMFADARLANVQLDLTQGNIYTLSPGTKQVLAGLKEPVTLRLFYSRQLGSTVPAYGTYADHVREMLRDYASISGGKVRLEFYDPEPFSDTEDRAMAYGLQGVPLDQGGDAGLFRPRRHQPGGRRADHPVLPGRTRAVPGIRPDQAGL